MAGVYRPRHPEQTVLYRVLFRHFGKFLSEYEGRFEKECGFLRPVVKEVVERYLDCGNSHIHFLATEGGFDPSGGFRAIPRIDDARLAELIAREVLAFLVGKELVSSEWAERLLSWQHTGFSVHSLVRAKTKPEA